VLFYYLGKIICAYFDGSMIYCLVSL